MLLSLASSLLLLAASLVAQAPSGHSERPLSAEEVAKLAFFKRGVRAEQR